MMSNEIKAAIKATVAAVNAELATGNAGPELRDLTQKAVEAAERVVGNGATERTRVISEGGEGDFYSPTLRVVQSMPGGDDLTMTGDKWSKVLPSKMGKLPSSIDWRGEHEYLGLNKFLQDNANTPIRRADLTDYIKRNSPTLVRITRSIPAPLSRETTSTTSFRRASMTSKEIYMATWEAMLEAHTGHRCVPSLDETWERRGTRRMRTLAIKIADGAVAEWNALSVIEKREAEPFDGAFLPDYLTRIRSFDPLILP